MNNQNVFAITHLLANNLSFRAQVSFETMAQVLDTLNKAEERLFPYNGMPGYMLDIVSELQNAVGYQVYGTVNGAKNPNDGGQGHARIHIGNENSFVIYVQIVTAYRLDRTHQEIKDALAAIAKKYGADEYSVEETLGSFEVRFWWD